MLDLDEGDQRALPIVQGVAGIAETERGRPANQLPDPVGQLPPDPGATFRAQVEAEQLADAQATVRGALHAGWPADRIRPWFIGVVADHHLSYDHGAIYSQKAFELLGREVQGGTAPRAFRRRQRHPLHRVLAGRGPRD